MELQSCTHCGSRVEGGDLRCPVCTSAVPAPPTDSTAPVIQIARCDECAAAVSYDPAAQAPRCAFCDATVHVEQVEDPQEQTELYLPFAVAPDAARRAVKDWLGTLGWFRPSDLNTEARVASIKPLYWVGWLFGAKAEVSWAADSDDGARRASWAPHAGVTAFEFDSILVSASRGLSDAETEHLAAAYRLESAVKTPEGPDNTVVEQFDVQRSAARDRVASAVEELARHRVKEGAIPGRHFRKVHVSPLLTSAITRRLAFPAYVLAYRYRGRSYRAVVNGQTPDALIGTAPYSWAKIAGLVLAILALAALAIGLASRL